MADIDELLKGSFDRLAEPANSAGVADAIRSRVAGGDAGTSVAGATAPGWGGGATGALSWLPVIGVVVAAGIVGGSLGAFGYLGRPVEIVTPDPASVIVATAPVSSCPGGEPTGTLAAGQHVLAVQRDESAANIGVRDPYDPVVTLWLSAGSLLPGEGQPAFADLPLGDPCPAPEVVVVTPDPEPTDQPEPEPTDDPDPNPQPPADTTPPVVKPGSWNPNGVYGTGSAPYCNEFSDIQVTIADNVAVTSVSASQSHPGSTVAKIGQSGTTYTFRFTAGVYSYPSPDLTVTVTFTAKDAAGNTASNTKNITIYNTCLI